MHILLLFLLLTVSALGQTNTNTVPAPTGTGGFDSNLLLTLIPLIVPIIVALIKAGIEVLPKWTLPIIAAGLGELLNFVSGLLGGPSTSIINGVLLGAAGTGLREIIDQIKKREP